MTASDSSAAPGGRHGLFGLVSEDLRRKALWTYESDGPSAILKAALTDGSAAMVLYRLMQWSRRHRLAPLEMVFNKLNLVFCHCLIGRGAEFGPGFVLIHAMGVVINGRVRGGSNVHIEHQVTIGARAAAAPPTLGDDVFIKRGGPRSSAPSRSATVPRIGAYNAVVLHDLPPALGRGRRHPRRGSSDSAGPGPGRDPTDDGGTPVPTGQGRRS